ncbi:MAG: alpha/beta fold hydrolase [Candidatus Didemnitutus sp.]|nr:alpha/beta fold hydrolase [Candidatus Didemnitutus sp.]
MKLFRSGSLALLCSVPLHASDAPSSVPPDQPSAQLFSADAYAAVKSFYEYDKGIPLDAKVVDRIETPAFVREKIAFTAHSGERIAGWLAVPKNTAIPPPCILVLHGVGSTKDSWWRPDNPTGPLAPRLIEAGYAVFMLDARFFGERSHLGDFANPQNFVGKNGWLFRFRDLIVHTVIDYRRALDYLATRPEIDPKRRMIFGYSMGGVTAINLLAVEPRLAGGVICVAPPMLAGPATGPLAAARQRLASVAPENHARALAGRPLLFLMANKDEYYTPAAAEAMIALIPGDAKQVRFFDSGHMLPHTYIDEVIGWMNTTGW